MASRSWLLPLRILHPVASRSGHEYEQTIPLSLDAVREAMP
jgi:hypothetical protein